MQPSPKVILRSTSHAQFSVGFTQHFLIKFEHCNLILSQLQLASYLVSGNASLSFPETSQPPDLSVIMFSDLTLFIKHFPAISDWSAAIYYLPTSLHTLPGRLTAHYNPVRSWNIWNFPSHEARRGFQGSFFEHLVIWHFSFNTFLQSPTGRQVDFLHTLPSTPH